MTTSRAAAVLTAILASALLLANSPEPAAAQEDGDYTDYGYGFYRTVEGEAVLTGLAEEAEPLEVEHNYPVLTGDRLWVTEGSRLEAVLPDRSILRVGEETELFFESLADSADATDGATTKIRLFEGEVQLIGDEYVLSPEPIRFDTVNCRVYLHLPGTYRLISDVRGWTEVVVREGFAEVNTDQGSVVARTGESVEIDGADRPRLSVRTAGRLDDLELWGEELSGELTASSGYVDDSLAYAAAPLERSGDWVYVSGRSAWRPIVRVGWRPFSDGWWVYTPSGLSWVAYEPWGWVTSHYGAWDYVPGYGWLWFPGTLYSPAWVYWYWGPTHTAWIPAGYYTRYYGPRFGVGFRFGVYGWAGGYWDSWTHWTFCPTRYFGRRGYRSYWRSGHEMHRDRRLRAVPRGIVTTDTRDLTPRRWGKPTEIVDVLKRRHSGGAGATRSLGDVTPFVERKATLAEETKRLVRDDDRQTSSPAPITVRGRSSRGRSSDVTTEPWHIDKPVPAQSVRSRSDSPGVGIEGRTAGSATNWELIERLRRFENKQDEIPRSPRALRESDKVEDLGRPVLRPDSPTRRILDGVRYRDLGTVKPRAPAESDERPTVQSLPSRRPSAASRDRSSVRVQPQERPSASSGSRSSGDRRSTMRSTPSKSGSSGKVSKPSGSSSGKRSGGTSRSSARKRGS